MSRLSYDPSIHDFQKASSVVTEAISAIVKRINEMRVEEEDLYKEPLISDEKRQEFVESYLKRMGLNSVKSQDEMRLWIEIQSQLEKQKIRKSLEKRIQENDENFISNQLKIAEDFVGAFLSVKDQFNLEKKEVELFDFEKVKINKPEKKPDLKIEQKPEEKPEVMDEHRLFYFIVAGRIIKDYGFNLILQVTGFDLGRLQNKLIERAPAFLMMVSILQKSRISQLTSQLTTIPIKLNRMTIQIAKKVPFMRLNDFPADTGLWGKLSGTIFFLSVNTALREGFIEGAQVVGRIVLSPARPGIQDIVTIIADSHFLDMTLRTLMDLTALQLVAQWTRDLTRGFKFSDEFTSLSDAEKKVWDQAMIEFDALSPSFSQNSSAGYFETLKLIRRLPERFPVSEKLNLLQLVLSGVRYTDRAVIYPYLTMYYFSLANLFRSSLNISIISTSQLLISLLGLMPPKLRNKIKIPENLFAAFPTEWLKIEDYDRLSWRDQSIKAASFFLLKALVPALSDYAFKAVASLALAYVPGSSLLLQSMMQGLSLMMPEGFSLEVARVVFQLGVIRVAAEAAKEVPAVVDVALPAVQIGADQLFRMADAVRPAATYARLIGEVGADKVSQMAPSISWVEGGKHQFSRMTDAVRPAATYARLIGEVGAGKVSQMATSVGTSLQTSVKRLSERVQTTYRNSAYVLQESQLRFAAYRNPLRYFELAEFYKESEEFERAIQTYKKVPFPSDQVLANWEEKETDKRDIAKAKERLSQVNLGKTLKQNLPNLPESVKVYANAQKEIIYIFFNIGQKLEDKKKYQEALEFYQKIPKPPEELVTLIFGSNIDSVIENFQNYSESEKNTWPLEVKIYLTALIKKMFCHFELIQDSFSRFDEKEIEDRLQSSKSGAQLSLNDSDKEKLAVYQAKAQVFKKSGDEVFDGMDRLFSLFDKCATLRSNKEAHVLRNGSLIKIFSLLSPLLSLLKLEKLMIEKTNIKHAELKIVVNQLSDFKKDLKFNEYKILLKECQNYVAKCQESLKGKNDPNLSSLLSFVESILSDLKLELDKKEQLMDSDEMYGMIDSEIKSCIENIKNNPVSLEENQKLLNFFIDKNKNLESLTRKPAGLIKTIVDLIAHLENRMVAFKKAIKEWISDEKAEDNSFSKIKESFKVELDWEKARGKAIECKSHGEMLQAVFYYHFVTKEVAHDEGGSLKFMGRGEQDKAEDLEKFYYRCLYNCGNLLSDLANSKECGDPETKCCLLGKAKKYFEQVEKAPGYIKASDNSEMAGYLNKMAETRLIAIEKAVAQSSLLVLKGSR